MGMNLSWPCCRPWISGIVDQAIDYGMGKSSAELSLMVMGFRVGPVGHVMGCELAEYQPSRDLPECQPSHDSPQIDLSDTGHIEFTRNLTSRAAGHGYPSWSNSCSISAGPADPWWLKHRSWYTLFSFLNAWLTYSLRPILYFPSMLGWYIVYSQYHLYTFGWLSHGACTHWLACIAWSTHFYRPIVHRRSRRLICHIGPPYITR